MYRKLSAPVAVQWEVTPACNERCTHCYNFWREGDPLPATPPDFDRLYTAATDEIIRNKVFMVVITGGEPLIVLDKIAPHIMRLTENGVAISMNTNLTLLTHKKAELLKKIGVYAILTSMPSGVAETCDQITHTKGSLKRIVRGITIAKEHGFSLFVNMVVSKLNFSEIEATAELVASIGVKNFAATRASNPMAGSGFTDSMLGLDEFRQMISRLTKVGKRLSLHTDSLEANPPCSFGEGSGFEVHRFCGAGKNTCTIGHNGQVRPCNRLPIGYGHIYDGLDKAWTAMDNCRSGEQIPVQCQPCKLKSRCGGGCKADALVAYGDIKQPDPLCDFTYYPEPKTRVIEPATTSAFTVNPRLKLRDEDFGAIAYVNVTNWLAIDPRTANILSPSGSVKLQGIANALSTNETAARMTAGLLLEKKILLPLSG